MRESRRGARRERARSSWGETLHRAPPATSPACDLRPPADLQALDPDRASARVQPECGAAFAEAAAQVSARDLATDADRHVRADRVARRFDREVRLGVERDLDAS